MNRRIMFVDDEPRVLEGLRRMLRPMRNEWEMVFCEGGEEALKQLAVQTYDVVVSDIRMPKVDGVQLFGEIVQLYPRIVRIALSGQTSEESMMRTVGNVHQFLSKPCDAQVLRSTVTRICALQDMLASEDLKAFVTQLRSLPPLPSLYKELLDAIQSPNASGKTIGAVIARDVSMTAKVLQLVNSAFFGIQRTISDPAEAVGRLGVNTIKNLVLSLGIFSRMESARLANLPLEELWSHSLRTSFLARGLCRLEGGDTHTADDAATGGMLHDIGKVVLAEELGERYDKMLGRARQQKRPVGEVETEDLGCSHAEVGAYLLGIWGLPSMVVEAVAFHHNLGDYLADRFSPVLAVHAADLLVLEADGKIDEVQADPVLARLGFGERLPAWRQYFLESQSKAA